MDMNRTRVTRGLAAALLLAAGMSGLGGATPFGTIPSALAAYPVSFGPQATYAVGTGPVGVAIGDFNGDGHPDLAVTNSGDNTVSVLLSTSKPTAAPVSRFRVSHTGRGLLFHWRLASASGIAGFTLLAHGRRVTSHLIPIHANQVYRVTVRTSPAGPYTLRVLFSSGRTATVHPLGPR